MGRSFSEIVLSDPRCVAYWPLSSDGVDLKGGNDLTLTDVTFSNGMAYFDGTSSSAVTGTDVDLSTTNKITVLAKVKLTYDLAAQKMLIEHSVFSAVNAGSFNIQTQGSLATDPFICTTTGNVGQDIAQYNLSLTRLDDLANHFIATTHNISLAGNESNYYQDAVLLTASSRTSINNTASFSAYPLYIGSRAGSSLFVNMYISEVVIFNNILTVTELLELYTSLNDAQTKNGILTKVMLASGYANYIGVAGKLYGYDLIGGTSASSVIFSNGRGGTTLWKDSIILQAAVGDGSARMRFKEPIVFSDDIYVTVAGTGAYVNVIYESME